MGRTGLLDGGREGHLHPLTLFALTLLALVVRSGLRRRKRLSGKPEAAYRG